MTYLYSSPWLELFRCSLDLRNEIELPQRSHMEFWATYICLFVASTFVDNELNKQTNILELYRSNFKPWINQIAKSINQIVEMTIGSTP